jgi:hypothetical protein
MIHMQPPGLFLIPSSPPATPIPRDTQMVPIRHGVRK